MPRAIRGSQTRQRYSRRRAAGPASPGWYRRRVDFTGRAVDVFLKESEFYHEAPSVRCRR